MVYSTTPADVWLREPAKHCVDSTDPALSDKLGGTVARTFPAGTTAHELRSADLKGAQSPNFVCVQRKRSVERIPPLPYGVSNYALADLALGVGRFHIRLLLPVHLRASPIHPCSLDAYFKHSDKPSVLAPRDRATHTKSP